MKFLTMNAFACRCHSDVFSAVTLKWKETSDIPRKPYYQFVAIIIKVQNILKHNTLQDTDLLANR
jgi:hypothetical protein